MTKWAIVGSRDFPDKDFVFKILDEVLKPGDVVVSGGARGVDSWAAEYAKQHNLEVKVFEPDWRMYGRGAGMRRNQYIVSEADEVIAFWDGLSKGTENTIGLAEKQGKMFQVLIMPRKHDTTSGSSSPESPVAS
jgi:predicted Rossmann fold nucleotide-binding protein DprA/Smf involved in DNA uptake